MIVPTMSYPEIYCVLENAAPKIRYKMDQLRPKAVKYFTREVWKYPAWKTYEYTIPATNDRPVDPKDFAEIMRRNELRMQVEDLESTL